MADPTLVLTLGDETFELLHLSAQEMLKVKGWTGFKNRQEWFAAMLEEDPEALLAGLVLSKQRKGEPIRFSEADFDLDTLDAAFINEHGQKVEPVLQTDDAGTVVLDAAGKPIPVLDERGAQQWRDVESGEITSFGQTA